MGGAHCSRVRERKSYRFTVGKIVGKRPLWKARWRWKYDSLLKYLNRSQWPRGLRRRSAAARLLRLWVRIPPGAWMSVCCECCVLSGRGLCDGLITRPEESYRLWCVVGCNLETSWMRGPCPTGGGLLGQKQTNIEAPRPWTNGVWNGFVFTRLRNGRRNF